MREKPLTPPGPGVWGLCLCSSKASASTATGCAEETNHWGGSMLCSLVSSGVKIYGKTSISPETSRLEDDPFSLKWLPVLGDMLVFGGVSHVVRVCKYPSYYIASHYIIATGCTTKMENTSYILGSPITGKWVVGIKLWQVVKAMRPWHLALVANGFARLNTSALLPLGVLPAGELARVFRIELTYVWLGWQDLCINRDYTIRWCRSASMRRLRWWEVLHHFGLRNLSQDFRVWREAATGLDALVMESRLEQTCLYIWGSCCGRPNHE